ncbi:non-specific lipid-transfer protein 2-like [Senna tora]|uniref:Non-specific lipid-transfer protein 2-like n=1 Tax=Senna tora TaxID=362788 RepID=A0A834T072_9FABA|nr:non-specific lipid-transfer protein 2-like [Senna tora]
MAGKKKACVRLMMVVVVMMMMVDFAQVAEGVTCSPVALSPCAGAITSSSPPSSACCQKLREQKPCLCGYLKNPSLRQYVNSPGAKKVASACGITIPNC